MTPMAEWLASLVLELVLLLGFVLAICLVLWLQGLALRRLQEGEDPAALQPMGRLRLSPARHRPR
jgi:hypothetical protein